MKLLKNYILVEIIEQEKIKAGIILTEKVDASINHAKVLDISENVSEVNKDDIVIIPAFTARKIVLDEYKDINSALISEDDILIIK